MLTVALVIVNCCYLQFAAAPSLLLFLSLLLLWIPLSLSILLLLLSSVREDYSCDISRLVAASLETSGISLFFFLLLFSLS